MDKFKNGMLSKISTLKELDIKVVGTFLIVVIGVGLGIYLLMTGGH